MFEHVKQMMDALLQDDEIFAKLAKLQRKYFEALVKEGKFSRQEALKIVAAQGDFFKAK